MTPVGKSVKGDAEVMNMGSISTRTGVGIVAAAALAVVAVTTVPGPGDMWLLNAAELACALALGLRAFLRPHHRVVWGLLCVALLAWTTGDVIYTIRPDLPVVLMTGHRGAVPAGAACELLAKPLRSASLAACLARHLQPAGDSGASS